jgi:hypothetical protein
MLPEPGGDVNHLVKVMDFMKAPEYLKLVHHAMTEIGCDQIKKKHADEHLDKKRQRYPVKYSEASTMTEINNMVQ